MLRKGPEGEKTMRKILLSVAVVAGLLGHGGAWGETGASRSQVAEQISKLMGSSLSVARKESYHYIRFDDCSMNYNVLGTYPSGGLYDIKFSDLDFSALNPAESSSGHDYTAFLVLNFSKPVRYRTDSDDLRIQTVVVNASDDDSAKLLFGYFLKLGELCRANPPK